MQLGTNVALTKDAQSHTILRRKHETFVLLEISTKTGFL